MTTDSICQHIRPLLLVILFFAVSGCAALSYGTYSGVDEANQVILKNAENYWAGTHPDILDFKEFKLMIKPHNWKTSINIWGPIVPLIPLPGGKNDSEYYSERYNQTSFLVSLWLEPKGHEMAFDPSGVVLRTPKGDEIKPIGFWGVTPYWDGCLGYQATKVERPPQQFTVGFEPISLTTASCFTVLFRTKPPTPNEPFVLTLSKGPDALAVRTISFIRRSGWNYSMPTLQ
jgi:hypothetical protein